MAMFRTVSKTVTYTEIENGKEVTKHKREKLRIEFTEQEETDRLAEEAANEAQQLVDETNRKRKKLIAYEKNKAIDAQIAPQRTAIELMDEAALDAAIDVAGI